MPDKQWEVTKGLETRSVLHLHQKVLTLGLGVGVDFTFVWDNNNDTNINTNNDNKNPHLNFLKGTLLENKEQWVEIRDNG